MGRGERGDPADQSKADLLFIYHVRILHENAKPQPSCAWGGPATSHLAASHQMGQGGLLLSMHIFLLHVYPRCIFWARTPGL